MGVLAGEISIEFNGASIRRDDSFSAAVAFRVDKSLFTESGGTREASLAVVVIPSASESLPTSLPAHPASPAILAAPVIHTYFRRVDSSVIIFAHSTGRGNLCGFPDWF